MLTFNPASCFSLQLGLNSKQDQSNGAPRFDTPYSGVSLGSYADVLGACHAFLNIRIGGSSFNDIDKRENQLTSQNCTKQAVNLNISRKLLKRLFSGAITIMRSIFNRIQC